MAIIPFEPPDWLKNTGARSIEERMMRNLPLDIDKTEGGFAWDLTYPTALECAEMLQFHFIRALQIMFPMWADGRWLDLHAHEAGLTRRAANRAYGTVTVEGKEGIIIPQGFVFAVPSSGGSAAICFETLETAKIPSSGTVDIPVQAQEDGTRSNVDNDTVTIMLSPMQGIRKVTNRDAMTGGTPAESDESLRQRIDDVNAGNAVSYVGNNADYARWAKEVPGVGSVTVIPTYNGPNSVKIVVIDANGLPANAQIVKNVFRHIWGADSLNERKSMERLAPVGVMDFLVAAPTPITVNYKFRLKPKANTSVEKIKENFKAALLRYYVGIASEQDKTKLVRYVKTAAVLADEVEGVADFKEFRVNDGVENITFHEDEYPVTGTIEVETYD